MLTHSHTRYSHSQDQQATTQLVSFLVVPFTNDRIPMERLPHCRLLIYRKKAAASHP